MDSTPALLDVQLAPSLRPTEFIADFAKVPASRALTVNQTV